jgi:hypothetical protein
MALQTLIAQRCRDDRPFFRSPRSTPPATTIYRQRRSCCELCAHSPKPPVSGKHQPERRFFPAAIMNISPRRTKDCRAHIRGGLSRPPNMILGRTIWCGESPPWRGGAWDIPEPIMGRLEDFAYVSARETPGRHGEPGEWRRRPASRNLPAAPQHTDDESTAEARLAKAGSCAPLRPLRDHYPRLRGFD